MTETKLGDLTIRPNIEGEVVDIHPSIGVVEDEAYVGVWIPCEVEGKKGLKTHRDLLHLVTDKRSLILANDEVFAPKGWRLAYKPIKFPNRWNIRNVGSFLNGEARLKLGVNPNEVFQKVLDAWTKYIEFTDPREYLFQSLWAIGTYFHHLFKTYPYNYITGPKRTGKTKCLMLHSCLCFNAFLSNNMSTSSIYRLIQNAKGTLLIDETEKLSNPERALDFRSILLSGYKKGAMVYRVEKSRKEQLIPEAFEVYSPKGLANIAGVEDVLEDRCIVTVMRRSINRSIADKQIDIDSEYWRELRNLLYLFYLGYWREIREEYEKISELSECSELVNFLRSKGISEESLELIASRELELWLPIFALAAFFDKYGVVSDSSPYSLSTLSSPKSLLSEIACLACDKAKQRQVENLTETWETILVQTLVDVVKSDGHYRVKDIKDEMARRFDEEEKRLNTHWVGNALRRLGFKEKRRLGTGYEYRLTVADVKDLAERMGIETQETGLKQQREEQPIDSFLSVSEAVEKLRYLLPKKFIESDFVEHAVKLGLDEDEASKLFLRLVDESRMGRDPEGYWQWL